MHVHLKAFKIKSVYCFATVTLIFVIFYLNNTSYLKKTKVEITTYKPIDSSTISEDKYDKPKSVTKYILLWTNPNLFPFVYFGEGNSIFKEKNCKYTNCFVTSNRQLLKDFTEFDIIAFNGPQLVEVISNDDFPKVRTFRQKYVYANVEAAMNYPVCLNNWDNYFNWTWTYKLDSDAIWGYIAVMNSSNHIIGPSIQMDWMSVDDMDSIDIETKKNLFYKKQAAAWFVSNCETLSKREEFVNELQAYLGDYNLKVDVYGSCGTLQCPKLIMSRCLDELEKKYYFYLAFENAMSEDYVTEKILYALDHYTVPIVYGGADYTRFLPPGSYLDALKLGPKNLAKEMFDIMENHELYYRFFRWRKYYSFHRRYDDPKSDEYCSFCAMANDERLMTETTIYENFTSWWTPKGICDSN